MSRPHKIWYRKARRAFYVEIFGKQHLLAKGPDNRETKAAAQRRFHEVMAEILGSRAAQDGEVTVAYVIQRFRVFSSKRDAQSTVYERNRYLDDFDEFYGDRLVCQCAPCDVHDWVDAHPGWVSPWTQHYAMRCVMRPFNWAAKMGIIDENPFRTDEWPECDNSRRPMTHEEYEKALAAAGPTSPLGRALRFLRYTGCRPGELRQLRWEHVHLAAATPAIVIPRHKTSRTQRKPKPRVIPLVPEVVTLLNEIAQDRRHSDYVFVTERRTPWAKNSLSQAFRRLRERIGLPEDVVLYGIRHRVGTDSMESGNSLRVTADILGQTQLRTTERYVHPVADLGRLASALARATGSTDSV